MRGLDQLAQAALQALVLIVIATIAIMAAWQSKWDVAGTALAGLFAALNLSRNRMPETAKSADPSPAPPGA